MTDEYQKALADLLDTMKHFMDFVSDDVTSVEIVVKNPRATVAMPMTLEGLHDTHRALKIASAVMGGLSDEAYDAGLAALDPHVIFYNGIDGEGTSRCSIGAAYKAMIAQILKEIEDGQK